MIRSVLKPATLQRLSLTTARGLKNAIVATEEFPFPAVTPKATGPPVISENKLRNGINLVTRDSGNAGVTDLKFAVAGGSGAETDAQKGAAHLLAVSAFAGNGCESGLKVVRSLEELGAVFSASVDREKIVYNVKVMSDLVAPVVSTVMSLIATPPQGTYVLQEMKSSAKIAYDNYEGDFEVKVSDMLHEAAFGEVSTLGAPIFATNLGKLAISDVMDYRTKHFVSENVTITANGISNAALSALVDEATYMPSAGADTVAATCPYVGGEMRVRADLGGHTFLGLAFPTPSGDAAKPFAVLEAMLSTSSSINTYSSGGLLSIYSSGSPAEATAGLSSAIAELKAIASKSPAEVEAAKNKVALSKMLALEGESVTESLMSATAQSTSIATVGDFSAVSASSISAAASAALKSVPSYAVLGKTAGTPSYATVCAMTLSK